ncbi:Cell division control protein 6 [Pseudozyma hubeiensis]|nr:Cell division control protein 6 [Pseudozyma hubeiensis]
MRRATRPDHLKMPLTRALSARLQVGSRRQPAPSAKNGAASDDIAALKLQAKASPSPSVQAGGATRALVAGTLAQLNVHQSSCKGSSSSSTTSAPATLTPSRARYVRAGSSHFSSRSSTSSRRSILGSSDFGDSSDDENDDERRRSGRLGGCSSFPSTADRPDDSNKENVAPFRCASQDVLETEARDAQHEDAIRRTSSTTRTNSLMERHTFSSPRRLSRSSTTSNLSTTSSALNMSRTPSRRMARSSSDHALLSSSPSTPTRRPSALSSSTRKRSRNDVDFDIEDASLPASPLSRLRLETPINRRSSSLHHLNSPSTCRSIPDEESGSYFPLSSQESAQSSLFDTHSIAESSSAPTSSSSSDCDVPSPVNSALLEAADQQKYSSVYAHARALLRYAAGVDPAETEAGLTITNAAVSKLGGHHVKVVGRESERTAIQLFLQQNFGLFADAEERAARLNVELDGDAEAACLYVCGLPGTGKTALVRSVLNSLSESAPSCSTSPSLPRVAFVNCMTLSHPRLIFGKVLQALGSNAAEGQSDAFAEQALSSLIRDGNQRILIVLDEMDHLLQSRAHQNILYKIFSWTANSNQSPGAGARGGSACSLIGIANSLDLTERFVPLLASKGASPALLHFRPFEANEIVSIIRDRLSGLYARYDDQQEEQASSGEGGGEKDSLALFTPTAVELLAKKIAGATGDLRKALDAARLAVELVEGEQRKKAMAEVEAERVKGLAAVAAEAAALAQAEGGEAEASTGSTDVEQSQPAAAVRAKLLTHLTPTTAPKVGPTQILKVLTSVLGSPNLSKIRNLGVQPKLVLLSILIAQARSEQGLSILGSATSTSSPSTSTSTGSALRIVDIEHTYHAILRSENTLFTPLEASELLGVFDMLEVNGVIRISSEVEVLHTSSRDGVTASSVVSPSGKRAAKKQLLAGSRHVYLAMSGEDVQRGICTNSPGMGSGAVADTIGRVWEREKERAVKAKVYHSIAVENARIRQDELGGGRMGVPIGSF